MRFFAKAGEFIGHCLKFKNLQNFTLTGVKMSDPRDDP